MHAIRIDQSIVSQAPGDTVLTIRSVGSVPTALEDDQAVPLFRTGSKASDQELLQQLRNGCVPFHVLLEQATLRQQHMKEREEPPLRRQTATWF